MFLGNTYSPSEAGYRLLTTRLGVANRSDDIANVPLFADTAVLTIAEEGRTYPGNVVLVGASNDPSSCLPFGWCITPQAAFSTTFGDDNIPVIGPTPLLPGFTLCGLMVAAYGEPLTITATFKIPTAAHPSVMHIDGVPDIDLTGSPTPCRTAAPSVHEPLPISIKVALPTVEEPSVLKIKAPIKAGGFTEFRSTVKNGSALDPLPLDVYAWAVMTNGVLVEPRPAGVFIDDTSIKNYACAPLKNGYGLGTTAGGTIPVGPGQTATFALCFPSDVGKLIALIVRVPSVDATRILEP